MGRFGRRPIFHSIWDVKGIGGDEGVHSMAIEVLGVLSFPTFINNLPFKLNIAPSL